VPVRDKLGGIVGVLVGRLDLSQLTEIMRGQAGFVKTGDIYVVSADRHFITEPRLEPSSGEARSAGIEQALTPGPNRNSQGIYENYNGTRVVGAYRWISDLEVVLLAEKPEGEALAGVRQLGLLSGMVAILALFMAAGVALYITARITRPISALTEAATAVAQGDLTRTVTIETHNEIGLLAQAFNSMITQLQELIGNLEGYARALETTGEISQQLTTILNRDELLRYVVDRIQTEFNYYHVQIYLLEEESGDLIMAEGSGEVGQQLKEKGHRLQAGQGIVGMVAHTNEHFLSNNVSEVSNFVRNPLLLDINSELAVPLRKGKQVMGVLNINSEQINRFTTEDVSLMQSIANQTAVAIENAHLLTETRLALQEIERLNRRLTRESWQQFDEELPITGYRFTAGVRSKISPASDAWLPQMKQAALKKELVKHTRPGNGDNPKAELAVPLVLRGELIGVLGVKRDTLPSQEGARGGWAEEEVAVVEAVATQITLALENARLSKEQDKTIGQLKDIDRLKSEFLTSMSHELRTPLNSIIGFADVLLQGIDGELNDIALNDIQLIHNSGKHLLALINDILDLAKIESGKMELVRDAVDIKEVTNAVLATSGSLVKDKPVRIIVDVPEMLPPVYADKLRLNQILLNLVSNAAKFTHEGTITIRAAIDNNKPDTMIISVVDTGIGIPANKLNTIFERFRQADSGTTRKYGGTGLGLPICRQLVEMHGGALNLRSEEGRGSEFYFSMPLALS
jgi:signal transduction histidine kinase